MVEKSTTACNNFIDSFMSSRIIFFVASFYVYVRTILFSYFGGYDTFTYFRGYLVLYQLMLRCWGYLRPDLWNGSRDYYIYGEGAATYLSSWYISNSLF